MCLMMLGYATLIATQAVALQGPVDTPLTGADQTELDAINAKYQSQYDDIERDSQGLDDGGNCLIDVKGTAEWGETKTVFDIPQMTMKNREFSFDTIKTSFKNRDFSMDIPSCYWGITKTFGVKYKIWKCGNKTKKWSTKIPEFKKERTAFSTKIPEFRSKRVEWKYHILKIGKIESVSFGCKKQQEAGNELSRRAELVQKAHMAELRPVLAKQIRAGLEAMTVAIKTVDTEMIKAVADMDASIVEIQNQGGNPAAVMVDIDDKQMNLPDARAYVAQMRIDLLAEMSNQQTEMEKQLAESEAVVV